MNDQVIIDELTRALKSARPLLNSHRGTAALHTLVPPIIVALETHPKFKNAPERFFGQKQLTLAAHHQGVNLLQVAVERSASDALAWLHKIHSAEVADVTFVAEVYGLQVTGQHTLRNGVKLMPLEQLPPSANAQGLLRTRRLLCFRPKFPQSLRLGRCLSHHKSVFRCSLTRIPVIEMN